MEQIKRKVNCLLQIARQSNNSEDHEIFKKECNCKHLAELKAQRESFHKFVDCAKDIKTLSKLAKTMQSEENKKAVGLLQDRNGVYIDSPEKSINLLADEHFPESKEVPPPQMYFAFVHHTSSW